MAFQAGEVVVLKSGGMQMTVATVDDDSVQVLWLGEEGDLFRETLPESVLELVPAAEAEDDEKDEDEEDDADDEEDEDEDDDRRRGRLANNRSPLPDRREEHDINAGAPSPFGRSQSRATIVSESAPTTTGTGLP